MPLRRGIDKVTVASNQPVDPREQIRHTAVICSENVCSMPCQTEKVNLHLIVIFFRQTNRHIY